MEKENMKKIGFSPELVSVIENMIEQMKNKDSMEIPNSNGLMLVRLNSKAYEEKEKDHSIMINYFDETFCVTSK